MATTAVSSVTQPNPSVIAIQTRLQQARREAARAESTVESLQAQTEQAQRNAADASNQVNVLEKDSERQAASQVKQMNTTLLRNETPLEKQRFSLPAKIPTRDEIAPYVNAQGQRTGRLLDVTA